MEKSIIGLGAAERAVSTTCADCGVGCGLKAELRGELQGIMWLGFALTEAVVFYGLVGGFLGFVLVSG